MTRKIVITGPESTGKTTLARQLAEYFDVPWVPEYARNYLEQLDRPYQQDDLRSILKGQLASEDTDHHPTPDWLFCDTSTLVLKVWWEFCYGTSPDWIEEPLAERPPHHYLLCDIDLPWQADPLRENPNDREVLMGMFRSELDQRGLPYSIIQGTGQNRLEAALTALEGLADSH